MDGFKLHNRGGGGFLCAVSRFKVFAKFWLPVLIWAALIYSVSADGKSVNHSSRIIEPLVRWLFPNVSNDTLWATILFVRKCAHVTEFAILTCLLWRGLRATVWRQVEGWSSRCAWTAWGVAVAFAASDEFHQSFVPGRQASPWDVMIDATGAALGLLLIWAIQRRRRAKPI